MAKKSVNRQERLAALRDKFKTLDLGSGGAGFWSPKVGDNPIRILPEVGDMDFFFQPVGRHTFPTAGNDRRFVYCPKFTSEGELDCPVCEIVDDLYKAGDVASKKMAGELRVRKMFWMNIVNREDESAGPLIFTPGVQVFSAITNIIGDPEYGDIFDIDDGIDIVVKRTGTGLNTEYQVVPRRASTPLGNKSQIQEWVDKARDLSYMEVSEDPEEDRELSSGHALYVLPYDRIVQEFDLDNLSLEDFDEEEDKEEVAVVSKRKSAAPAKRHVVDEEEDDDEEEDEEEESPVKKEVTRRVARRSRRR
jgi:hypothetical protein